MENSKKENIKKNTIKNVVETTVENTIKNTVKNPTKGTSNSGRVVLMFPGQGSQYIGMGKEFLIKNSEFNKYFDISSDILGENLLSIINDSNNKGYLLNKTKYSQIAIYTLSCVLNDYLMKQNIIDKGRVKYTIGHSLGDYSALYSCGGYDFQEGAKLVVFRGKLMAGAASGGNTVSGKEMMMAAVIGSDINTILNVLKKYENSVFVANCNDYSQIVISGYKDKVLNASDEIKNLGAKKIIPLKVSIASHCPLMKEASIRLSEYFDKNLKNFSNLNFYFFSSTEVKKIDRGSIKETLIRQLVSPVRWVDSIEKIVDDDSNNEIKSFIEIGPQKVLSGLVRRILPRIGREDIAVFNTDTYEDIERIVNEA